jgi:eukaryotic-like serine/threonine-protein kinase
MPEPKPQNHADLRQQDLTGFSVGRFDIQLRLGAGGMGEVYRAQDTKLHRMVAIKRIFSSGNATHEDIARLLREGQRASSLNHPNIAAIYDVLEDRGEVLLVMEYVEGTTLRDRLAEPGTIEQFLGIAIQCADALAAAHEKKILHSDVKPENIMLTPSGQVKLLDFGVARRLGSPGDTTAGSLLSLGALAPVGGTPAYMPPEVLLGGLPDARSDIFGLGLVMYEMFTGTHPFRRPTETTPVPLRILQEEAIAANKINPAVPENLARVVAKCMAKDPAQRYDSAKDLVDDLRAVERGSKPKVALRAATDNRKKLAWAALSIVVLLLAIGFSFSPMRSRITSLLHRSGAATVGEQETLAVLPVQVAGEDAKLQAFASGLGESVSSKLSQLSESHSLGVVSPSQVRDKKVSTAQDGYRQFGANLAVQMSLQEAGDLRRVSYALVDGRTGKTVSGNTITAPISDPFRLQDEVAAGVVQALKIRLRPDEQTAISAHGTDQPAAYGYYLQARGYLQDYSVRPEHIDDAMVMLEQAIKADPNFGLAYATRGEAKWDRYQTSKDSKWVAAAQTDCSKAIELANAGAEGHVCLGLLDGGTGENDRAVVEFQRALQLDSTSDEAYVGLARAYTALNKLDDAEKTYQRLIALRPNYYRGYNMLASFYLQQAQYEKAAQIYQQAIRLAPENSQLYYNLGGTYLFLGRDNEAISALQQSIKIRPTAGAYSNLGTAMFRVRRFGDAANNYIEALKLDNNRFDIWGNLADAYFFNGQHEQAMKAYEKELGLMLEQLRVNPNNAVLLGNVAACYGQLGKRADALQNLDKSLQLGHSDKDLLFNAAVVYNELGDTGVALEWLQKAISAGYSRSVVRTAPIFDNLHENVRFQQMLQESSQSK